MRDIIVIRVLPSLQREQQLGPLVAWIEGCKARGHGSTVSGAIDDLFTSAEAGKVCRPLEQAIQRALEESA